ncbi:MAG: carotenoid biosynthesis protein [cyanobacterium endosymbiont of Rhopalodia inflata]
MIYLSRLGNKIACLVPFSILLFWVSIGFSGYLVAVVGLNSLSCPIWT